MKLRNRILSMTIAFLLLVSTFVSTAAEPVNASTKNPLLTYKGQGHLDVELVARYTSGAEFAEADTMKLVFNSGVQLERVTKLANPSLFNTNHEVNEFDSRFDDKEKEPKAVVVGKVDGVAYAFVGLERAGGIMAYDIANPTKPVFDTYFSSRSYNVNEEVPSGDVAPEGLTFIEAANSPTGSALLVVANELSGNVAVYEVKKSSLTRVQIIATNDIHSRVVEGDGMGYAKLATVVEQYKALNKNTLVLDAGDTLHGQTYSTLVEGSSIVELMNAIGYDAMTTGNHDYNYGTERLEQLATQANFPILAANVIDKNGNLVFDPYVIKEVAGIKIGIFGIATPETVYKTHPKNVEGLTFTDPAATVQKMVNELEAKVDVIINLAHLGTDGSTIDANRADLVTAKVDGVDLVIDGHSHELVNKTINNTLLVQFGEYGKQVGIITLEFDNKKLVNKSSVFITADDAKSMPANTKITNLVNDTTKEQSKILDQVIAKTAIKLEGERAVVRTSESNLGNLITDAMLDASGAHIALTNGGGIRASITEGDITVGDVVTVLPFGNFIVTIEVTGQELKDALEVGATGYPAAHGAFAHVGGISYTINARKEVGQRIENVQVGGKTLDLKATYTLATNDFLAAGGDNYTMFADNTIINYASSLDEALIAYMKQLGTVNVTVQNRINVIAGEQTTATEDQPTIQVGQYIILLGDNLSKIAKQFGTTWREL